MSALSIPGAKRNAFRNSFAWRIVAAVYLLLFGVTSAVMVLTQGILLSCIIVVITSIFFFGPMFALQTIFFSVRVGEQGLQFRGILDWRTWPWRAFQEQRISNGGLGLQYVWRDEPLGFRKVSLNALPKQDAWHVAECIQRHGVLEQALGNSKEISLETSEVSLRPAGVRFWFIGPAGMRMVQDGIESIFSWEEVERVQVDIQEHVVRAILRIRIKIHSKNVTHAVTTLIEPTVSNKSGRMAHLLALLERNLSPERLHFTALDGPPQSIDEAKRRLEVIEKRFSPSSIVGCLTWFMLYGCLFASILFQLGPPETFINSPFLGGAFLVCSFLVYLGIRSSISTERNALKNWILINSR